MAKEQLPELRKYRNNYTEPGLWAKIAKVAQKAGIKVVYLALLFYYVLKSGTTTTKDRSLILGALGYFILPLDLIPDAIPVVGFSDDLAALIAVYVAMKHSITPEIELQAQTRLEKWFPQYSQSDIDIHIIDLIALPDRQIV